MQSDFTPPNEPSEPPLTELEILLEDGPLIAVNKPAGLLTQGVPHAQPSLEWRVKAYLKQKLAKPGNVYLGVPHRLDRPVSGIVIFGKNSKAAARLAEQFRERSIQKTYLAVTETVPIPSEGTDSARQAVLDYAVIAVKDGRALIEIELHTGRMHQIRVQLASRGWPIIDDCQYGATLSPEQRANYDPQKSPIALHARRLILKHPVRYDVVRLEAPVPPAWSRFGFVLPKGT